MRKLLLGAFVAPVLLLGCGGPDTSGSGGGGPNTDTLTFETGTFEAPPGDSFTCFYLDATTPKELSVTGASGTQGPGGHHIIVYYTDDTRSPTHHPCVDSEMVSWHQIAGSAGQDSKGAEGIVSLPEGLAIKVPAGKQLVLQAHYINTTGKTQTVDNSVTLKTIEPSEVKAYANYFVHSFEGFEVPANGSLKTKSVCTVPQDLNTVLELGHMHEYGTRFTMQVADENDDPTEMLYDEAWQPLFTSHPPIKYFSYDKPHVLTKGTKLLQTCEWENPTTDPLLFPREMCVGFFYYYPDMGELACDTKAVP